MRMPVYLVVYVFFEPTYTLTYSSDESVGWRGDIVAVERAIKQASSSSIDFKVPRFSKGYFFPDHNEGGRFAVLVDASNSWMFFYSTFDD